jgi:hypothetical protein
MPAALERDLRRRAKRLGLRKGSKRWRAYVFGTWARIKARRKGRR